MKHKAFRKNNGKWSCSVCRWEFDTRPNKDNCPGVLRIWKADENYKTLLQWRALGYEPIISEGRLTPKRDAISIVHSTEWYEYYHRDNVRKIEQS